MVVSRDSGGVRSTAEETNRRENGMRRKREFGGMSEWNERIGREEMVGLQHLMMGI